jgi:hypothetical protein
MRVPGPPEPTPASGAARLDRRTLLVGGLALAGLSVARPALGQERPSGPYRREEWAGGLRPKGRLEVEDKRDVLFLLVHHSVSTNTYTADQVPDILRGIYRSHTGPAKRWPDVAYNFFVDRFGRIWEGREGSLEAPVKGSATGGSQGFGLLCCFLGDHRLQRPSPAALRAMTELLTGLAVKYDIDTTPGARTRPFRSRGSNRWPAGTTIRARTISGHREMSLTECPGDAGFAVVRDYLPRAVSDMGGRGLGGVGAPTRTTRARAGGGAEPEARAGGGAEPEARAGGASAPATPAAEEGRPLAPLVLPGLALGAGLAAAATVVRRRWRTPRAGGRHTRPAVAPPAGASPGAARRPVNVGAPAPATPSPTPAAPVPAPASAAPIWRVVGGLQDLALASEDGGPSRAVRHVRVGGILAVVAAEGTGSYCSGYGPRAAVGSVIRDVRLIVDRARFGWMDLEHEDPELLFRAVIARARNTVLQGARDLGVAPDRWTTTLSCVLAFGQHLVCGQVGAARIVVQTRDHAIKNVAAAPGGANGHPRNLTAADALDQLTVEVLAAADVRCFALSAPITGNDVLAGTSSSPRLSLHDLFSLAGQASATGDAELQSVTQVHDRNGNRRHLLAVAAQRLRRGVEEAEHLL